MSGVAVVSYRNSTSNHNVWLSKATHKRLYLIEILHQTTTAAAAIVIGLSCILSKFYIKPQRNVSTGLYDEVVSYRNSTSNHNNARRQWRFQQLYLIEILHQTTTSGDGLGSTQKLYLIEILHQTTTRVQTKSNQRRCILSKFYIKPQPSTMMLDARCGCILSKFYIKPQLPVRQGWRVDVVSYRNSTSNHNSLAYGQNFIGVVSYRNSTSNHNLEQSNGE